MASHRDRHVYLSDGGHFNGLGVYELIRRRCKIIIAIDALGEPSEKDAELNFGGIGDAVRRARIDFGTEIAIDLKPLMRDKKTGKVSTYFALADINYPTADGKPPTDDDKGLLVLIKAGRLDGFVPADLINYGIQVDEAFPHVSTGDVQFSEFQFESYRQLGYFSAQKLLGVPDPETTQTALTPTAGAVPATLAEHMATFFQRIANLRP